MTSKVSVECKAKLDKLVEWAGNSNRKNKKERNQK